VVDYLQNLYDQLNASQNPLTYGVVTTPAEEEEAKRKKKGFAGDTTTQPPQSPWGIPARPGPDTSRPMIDLANPANPVYGANPMSSLLTQRGGVSTPGPDTSRPMIDFANPANPTYGANPMSSALTQRKVQESVPPQMPSLGTQAGLLFGGAVPQKPPSLGGQAAVMFGSQNPEEEVNPNPPAGRTPIPRARPAEAPREPDGSHSGQPDTVRTDDAQAGKAIPASVDGRPVVNQAGEQAGMLSGLGGFGNRIMQGLGENSNLLLAMGAGLLGAPTLAQGLSRGFAYAGPASQADIARQQQMGSQQASYNALIQAGVPQHLAAAGATDPEMRKQLLQSYIDPKYEIKEVKSKTAWGAERSTLYAINPRDPSDVVNLNTGQHVGGGPPVQGQTVGTMGANGQIVQTPSGGGGGGGGKGLQQAEPQSQFAPGVTEDNFDHTKRGEDYIAQFSPEVQAEIRNRTKGMPAGGYARGKPEVLQQIQMAADKYGEDVGLPMDTVSLSQRRIWANSLADTKSGVGLQAKGFKQGLEHLANLSDKWVAAHQSGGMGIEPLARLQNRAITSKQTAIYDGIVNDAGKTAGEVGKLFSSGGTGHERQETQALLGDTKKSGRAAAGGIRSTLELMMGGLRPLERQRDQLFPAGTAPRGSDFMSAAEEANIAKIEKNLSILEGQQPAGEATPAATVPRAKGNFDYDPATGTFKQR
jgi:hypothetical protein